MDIINDSAIQSVLLAVLGLVLIIVAIGIAGSAKKARVSDNAATGVNVTFAIIIAGLGAGSIALAAFGETIFNTLFNL